MVELEREWHEADKVHEFTELRPFLDGEAAHGGLAELAENTGRPEGTLRSQLHRLRRAFRGKVKDQIAPTLEDVDEVAGEMEVLLSALGGRDQ